MPDKTTEMAQFIRESYPAFEFVSIRLSNAFDKLWWEEIRGVPMTKSDFGMNLDPGAPLWPTTTALALTVFLADLAFIISENSCSTPLESLRTYFRSLPTQTAVHSSIQTLIRVLLLHIAQSTNSSHVVLGTSLTSLAISLISGISQGGGYNVREEAQEDWTPSKDGQDRPIRLIRPLRDVSVKECGTYAWWRGLKVIGKEKWPGGRQSISGLTKGTSAKEIFGRALFIRRLGLSRVYIGVGEGLPFYCVNNNPDLRQVGVEGCTGRHLLNMPKARGRRSHTPPRMQC